MRRPDLLSKPHSRSIHAFFLRSLQPPRKVFHNCFIKHICLEKERERKKNLTLSKSVITISYWVSKEKFPCVSVLFLDESSSLGLSTAFQQSCHMMMVTMKTCTVVEHTAMLQQHVYFIRKIRLLCCGGGGGGSLQKSVFSGLGFIVKCPEGMWMSGSTEPVQVDVLITCGAPGLPETFCVRSGRVCLCYMLHQELRVCVQAIRGCEFTCANLPVCAFAGECEFACVNEFVSVNTRVFV